MKSHHAISALVIVTAVAAIASGCGGSSNASPASQATTSSQSASSAVTISDFKFAPATLTVKSGTQIDVTNDDSTTHTATADDGSFDTGDLGRGSSKTITVKSPGTHPYHCSIHPFMQGKLVVK